MDKSKTYKILIVDDEQAVRDRIINFLECSKFSFDILQAFNGSQALKIVNRHCPDLIITDWDMPIMNGLELITRLQENEKNKSIPVIVISGIINSLNSLYVALNAGAFDFIAKPINQIELIARANAAIKYIEKVRENLYLKNKEQITNFRLKINSQNS